MAQSVSSRGSLSSRRDRLTESYNTGRAKCMGHRSRASFKDVWFEEPHRGLRLVESLFGRLFCCCSLKILNNFQTRGLIFLFCMRPYKLWSLSCTEDMLLAGGGRNGSREGDAP